MKTTFEAFILMLQLGPSQNVTLNGTSSSVVCVCTHIRKLHGKLRGRLEDLQNSIKTHPLLSIRGNVGVQSALNCDISGVAFMLTSSETDIFYSREWVASVTRHRSALCTAMLMSLVRCSAM